MAVAEKRSKIRAAFGLTPEIKATPKAIGRSEARITLPMSLQTVDEIQAAEITGFSVKALQQRRWLGKPPVYLKVGRLVRYRISDLEKYLDSCTVEPMEAQNAD